MKDAIGWEFQLHLLRILFLLFDWLRVVLTQKHHSDIHDHGMLFFDDF
jgi:hypothetical protein